jgi:hypothetical protein
MPGESITYYDDQGNPIATYAAGTPQYAAGGAGADGLALPDVSIQAAAPTTGLLPAPVKILLVVVALVIGTDILKSRSN